MAEIVKVKDLKIRQLFRHGNDILIAWCYSDGILKKRPCKLLGHLEYGASEMTFDIIEGRKFFDATFPVRFLSDDLDVFTVSFIIR